MSDFSRFSCFIFDLDGTLLDSTSIWAKVDMDFLGKRGIPNTREYMEEIKLHTFETGAVYTKEKFGLSETVDEIIKEWFDMAYDAYSKDVCVKPYAKQFLSNLKASGKTLAVATSSDEILFKDCLKRNEIFDLFDSITQTKEVLRGKRFPDVYLKAASKSSKKVSDCLVFEDVLSAIQAAKAGGFKVVGVYDESSKDDWEEIKRTADYFIYSYKELL